MSERVLLLNLGRFGDLIQTQGTISGLRGRGGQVGLVCLDCFAEAARLLAGLDALFPVPGAHILETLDRSWPEALGLVQELRRAVATFSPQRVINLTPSISARLLARLLGDALHEGFLVDAEGFGRTSSLWADFLQAVSAHRGCSPFNLVDIQGRMCGALPPLDATLTVPEGEVPRALSGPLVALQLGASHPARRYPVAGFVEAARQLVHRVGVRPVLVGTAAERPLAEEFAQLADFPFHNLMGQTDLLALARVLRRCQALLSNDTGTMHLAAGLGVPVVAIFLATAQPWDTGPYAEGCVCLEPDMDCHPCSFGTHCPRQQACHGRIGAAALGQAVAQWLASGIWVTPPSLGARVWGSVRDGAGFMDLASLSGHEGLWRLRWLKTIRPLYRQFLDGEPGLTPGALLPDPPEPLFHALRQTWGWLHVVHAQAQVLQSGAHAALARKMIPYAQRVEDTLLACPELAPLGVLWRHTWRQHERLDALAHWALRLLEMLRALGASVGMQFE